MAIETTKAEGYRKRAASGLHRIGVVAVAMASLTLSACVELQMPLISDARPLIRQQFEVHLYENFVDGKANDFPRSRLSLERRPICARFRFSSVDWLRKSFVPLVD